RIDHVLVAVVNDRLADRLAIVVVRDRPTAQSVLLEDVSTALEIAFVFGCCCYVEMITPTGDLQPVIAPSRSQPAHLFEREVGPLSGEQCDRSVLGRLGLPSGFLQTAGVSWHRILLVGV